MSKQKMLVTGGAGVVGSYVPEVFTDFDLVRTDQAKDLPFLDVRDPAAVVAAVRENKPDIVLHLAAATDVDRCEKEPDWAYHHNAIGTQNVVLACQEMDVTLVYISTAGVFWGEKPEPYTEFDAPRPANIYGHSKLAGENLVTSLLRRYYIVRAGWMIGGGEKDQKFVGKITRLILQGQTDLRAVDDKVGSLTYAKDLLSGIRMLIGTGYYGLFHMVNNGVASRYEIAREICRVLGREDITLNPVSSAYFPLPAPRARSEAMRNLKLDLMGLNPMRSWQEALGEYLIEEVLPRMVSKG